MWFHLVESDRFIAIVLPGTVTGSKHTHTHTSPSERRTFAQINFSRLGFPQGGFRSDRCSGGSAAAVERCVFLEYPRHCHLSEEKKRILEKRG